MNAAGMDEQTPAAGVALLVTIPLVWVIHAVHLATALVLNSIIGMIVAVAWTLGVTALLLWAGVAATRGEASPRLVAVAASLLFVPAGVGGLTAVHLWSFPLLLATLLVLAAALFCLGQVPRQVKQGATPNR